MTITSLRITDFRNLVSVELKPCLRGLNILYGNNGSGKTSLLEAVHYLGHGRSFRSSTSARLIRHHTDKFSIFAQVVNELERQIPIGVERDVQGLTKLKVAENEANSILDVAYFLPIRVINSQSHQLFESGPAFRRKYIDWGLFYQHNESFLTCWRYFERVLKQRNAILRSRRPKNELDVWTEELVKYGEELDRLRRAYVAEVEPFLQMLSQELLDNVQLKIQYQSGWEEGLDYRAALSQLIADEYRSGHTLAGPHRADLDILIEGVSAKHLLSRGQQKMLICAMILSQGILLAKYTNKGIIYLVDDLPSELDLTSRQRLISLLSKQPMQVFVTAIERDLICNVMTNEPATSLKVFHVEQGKVVESTEDKR